MNKTIFALIRSAALTSLVSVIVAEIAHYYKQPFWLWFTIVFIIQVILFYLYNNYLEYRSSRDLHRLQIQEAELLLKNTMEIECASCKKKSIVVINLGTTNQYTCGHCKVKNSIYIEATTAVSTEPIYDPAPPQMISKNGN